MTDYLAEMRDHAAAADDSVFGSPAYLAHLTAATAFAGIAVAEAQQMALRAVKTGSFDDEPDTLPQGTVDTGQTTGTVTPSPSPAEPSLVALDHGDEATRALRRWRAADRMFPPESADWWDETLRLRDVADRLGLAL